MVLFSLISLVIRDKTVLILYKVSQFTEIRSKSVFNCNALSLLSVYKQNYPPKLSSTTNYMTNPSTVRNMFSFYYCAIHYSIYFAFRGYTVTFICKATMVSNIKTVFNFHLFPSTFEHWL